MKYFTSLWVEYPLFGTLMMQMLTLCLFLLFLRFRCESRQNFLLREQNNIQNRLPLFLCFASRALNSQSAAGNVGHERLPFPAAEALLPANPVWLKQQRRRQLKQNTRHYQQRQQQQQRACWDIKSHLFSRLFKHTVIRMPFHSHLESRGCQPATDRKVSSARFFLAELLFQLN